MTPPEAGMFIWAPLPKGFTHMTSLEYNGEGYVRIGLVENEQRIRQAARNVKQFLSSVQQSAAE